MAVLNQEVFRR